MAEPDTLAASAAPPRTGEPVVALRPILVAEDNPDDLFFLRHALKRLSVANPLLAFENGQAAIAYLDAQTSKADGELPRLMFLDIKCRACPASTSSRGFGSAPPSRR